MGNDGGSIPTRRELVKSAPRNATVSELKATAFESVAHAWKHDALTSEPLDMQNVVSDCLGRLYNYESILNALMPDNTASTDSVDPEPGELTFAATGIHSVRDLVQLKFKGCPPSGSKDEATYACPLTMKELGPSSKAVYLVPCGHVFSEAAMREVQTETCPECTEPFKTRDVIPILSTEKSELEMLKRRTEQLLEEGLAHSLKKDKRKGTKKQKKAVRGSDAKDNGDARFEKQSDLRAAKPVKKREANQISGINNPKTASLTARVLAEQEERNKQRKMAAT